MGHRIVIGMVFNQKFETGDVVPQDTAIYEDFCHTVISCVGKAPATLEYDDPNAEMSYHEWNFLLTSSKGLRELDWHIKVNKKQIIYLSQPSVKQILAQIKKEIPKMKKGYYRDRSEWLVFWADESIKRYDTNAAIGLF